MATGVTPGGGHGPWKATPIEASSAWVITFSRHCVIRVPYQRAVQVDADQAAARQQTVPQPLKQQGDVRGKLRLSHGPVGVHT